MKLKRKDKDRILKDPNSAQVKYRPVLQERVPDLPNPTSSSFASDRDWWVEQLRRCTEGYIAPDGVYINPIYYFFLNFMKVNIFDELTGREGYYSPYYRDGDKVYFDKVWYGMSGMTKHGFKDADNIIVAKGRRKGWSTSEWGITLWWFLFNQNQNILRAYPNKPIIEKERRRLKKMYEYIHPFFKRDDDDRELDIVVDNAEVISQGYWIDGRNFSIVNSINLTIVDAKGSGVRGDALGLIVVVEAGIHTHLSPFIGSANDTLRQGDYKVGMLLVGGTSDSINNKSTDYKDNFLRPKGNKFKTIFTPASICYQGYIDYYTGKSLREEAEKVIKEERNSPDLKPEDLKMKIQENPLTVYESFIPSNDTEYDKEKIDSHYLHILEHDLDSHWITGKFVEEKDVRGKMTGRVIFKEDPTGFWKVLEGAGYNMEDVENAFVAGIDDVYKDKVTYSDSLNSMVIYRRPSVYSELSDLPVAFYLGRHKNRMLDWQEFYKAILYYDPKVMYEHNESAGFIGYAREKGIMQNLLYVNGEIGVRLSDSVVADMTVLGIKYFEANRHLRISHTALMDSFNYWRSEVNNDITSAFHLVLLALEKTKNLGTIRTDEEVDNEFVPTAYVDFGFGRSENMFSFGR